MARPLPEGEDPIHPAVEGPETELDSVREQSHEVAGARERAAALEARQAELLDRLARLQADFENFRRRMREEGKASEARGKEIVARALLPALDSLDLALEHGGDEGVRLVARQLADALASVGVEAVAPTPGEAFDAKRHEAVTTEPGEKSGTVVRVLAKGYAFEGRVLRPARVTVAL